jgi:hypothetical protein
MTSYPGALDTFRIPQNAGPHGNPFHHQEHKKQNEAIVAIETALGAGFGGYAEGLFTPAIADDNLDGSGEGQSYSIQNGFYTKIGNRVFFNFQVTITDLGTLTTGQQAKVVGLPFTSSSASNSDSTISVGFADSLNITANQAVTGIIAPNVAHINLYLWDAAAGTTAMTLAELSAGGRLIVSGHYRV